MQQVLTLILAWLEANPQQVAAIAGVIAAWIIGRLILVSWFKWLTPESDNLKKSLAAVIGAVVMAAITEGLHALGGKAFDWPVLWTAFVTAFTTSQLALYLWKALAKLLGLKPQPG